MQVVNPMELLLCAVLAACLMIFAACVSAQISNDTREAELISVPKVDVPAAARSAGIGGKVVARVKVDKMGNVTSVEDVTGPDWVCPVVKTEPVIALRSEARKAALKAKFKAAIAKGKEVPSEMIVNFQFPQPAISNEGVYVVKDRGSGDQTEPADENVIEGRALSLPKPDYPAAAKAAQASGSVKVQVLIATDGSIYSAEPVTGHPLLRSAARKAGCSAKFAPTIVNGQRVKVEGYITYNFVP